MSHRNSWKSLLAGVIASVLAGPASADLILNTTLTLNGTGLGAVPTLVTIQQTGRPPGDAESGCISAAGGSSNQTCLNGLLGGDNVGVNSLRTAADLPGIANAGQLALVVNVSEIGGDPGATLTDLYLSIYNLAGTLLGNHQYTGLDLPVLADPGVGSAGTVFTLDAAEQLLALAECPDLLQCRFGAGIQFAAGTASGAPETVFLSFLPGDDRTVPEPATLELLGASMAMLGFIRRRRNVPE